MSQHKGKEFIKIITFVRSVPADQISGLGTKTLSCQSYNLHDFSFARLVPEFCCTHIQLRYGNSYTFTLLGIRWLTT